MPLRSLLFLFPLSFGCATVTPPCDVGTTKCDGLCIDLSSDVSNCGQCGAACEIGNACVAGNCVGECAAGLERCGSSCADLRSSPLHCGDCGTPCASGDVCLDGTCTAVCPEPRVACGGSCVDLTNDPRNCGACDTACGEGLVCSDGECAATCQTELEMCVDRCTDVQSDRMNCGDCGNECPGGNVCDRGACVLACPPGQTDCVGRCIDLNRDAGHCGDCGTRCAEGEFCDAGTCMPTCSEGLTECNGECVDFDHDPEHCGGCEGNCPDDGDVHACLDGLCYTLPCGDDCWGAEGCMTAAGRCIRFTCRAGNGGAAFCNGCLGWSEVTYDQWMNRGYCGDVIATYHGEVPAGGRCGGGALSCCGTMAGCGVGDCAWHFHDGVNNRYTGPNLCSAVDVNCSFWNGTDNSAYNRMSVCERN